MSTTVTTTIRINALDAASAKLATIGANVGRMQRQFSAAQRRISASMNSIATAGATMTAAVTLPVAAVGRSIFNTVESFESASARLGNVLRKDISQLTEFQEQAMRLAPVTPYSPDQIVGAQLELAMSGFSEAQIKTAVPDVLNFATMAEISIPKAAMMSSDVIKGLGLEASELARVMDMAAKASTISNQTAEQFMTGLARSAPIARAAGMSVEDLMANLAALANAGFKAAEGGNALRTILLRLSAPTAAAQRQFSRLGLDIADFGGGKLSADSLINTLVEVGAVGASKAMSARNKIDAALTAPLPEGMSRQAFLSDQLSTMFNADSKQAELISKGIAETISSSVGGIDHNELIRAIDARAKAMNIDPLPLIKEIFGVQRSAQASALLASATGHENMVKGILDSNGIASESAQRLMDTLGGIKNALKSVWQTVAIELGEAGLKDFFKSILTGSIVALNAFRSLDEGTKGAIVGIAIAAASVGPALLAIATAGKLIPFALGPAISVISATIAVLGALLSPIGLVVAAVGTLAVFGGMKLFGGLFETIKNFGPLQDTFSRIGDGFKMLKTGFTEADGAKIGLGVKVIKSQLGDLWSGIKDGAKVWATVIHGVDGARTVNALAGTLENLRKIATNLGSGLKAIAGDIVEFFGMVGPGEGENWAAVLAAISEKLESISGWLADKSANKYFAALIAGALLFRKTLMRLLGFSAGKLFARLFPKGAAFGAGRLAGLAWKRGFDAAARGRARITGAGGRLAAVGGNAAMTAGMYGGAAASVGKSRIGRLGAAIARLIPGAGFLGKMLRFGGKAVGFLFKGMLRIIPGLGWGLFALDIARFFFPQIDTALANVWAKLKPILSAGWEKTLAAGAAVAKAAKDFGRSIFSFFTATIPAWIKATGAWFGRQYEAMVSKAMAAGEWLTDAVKDLLASIKTSFSEGFAAALEIGQDVLDKITKTFEGIGTKLVDAIKAPFVGIGDWIMEQVNAALDLMPDGMKKFLGIEVKPANGDDAEGGTPGGLPEIKAPVINTPTIPQNGALQHGRMTGSGTQSMSEVQEYLKRAAVRRKELPAGLLPKAMTLPDTFDESGAGASVGRSADMAAAVKEAVSEGLTSSGFMDASAKIDVHIKTPKGVSASGITNSQNADVRLNTGRDPLAP